MSTATRFVTFPLGDTRYALYSRQVKELLMPTRVYSFPHTMQALRGVLVRNGAVIPVCDLGGTFGRRAQASYYVVARCKWAENEELVAIPVNGNCEIVQGEFREASDEVSFASGVLNTASGDLPLLDLDWVVAMCVQPSTAEEAAR